MKQNNIVSAFEEQVQAHPQALALIHHQETLTYAALNERVNRLAHYLLSIGLQANAPVALCLSRSIDVLVAMLAILKAGGGYLPIDVNHPTERLALILNSSQADLVITSAEHQPLFTQYKGKTLVIETIAAAVNEQISCNPGLPIAANQLAYVIYTSGSTGTPKGVVIEHGNVLNYCQWFAQYSEVSFQQRVDFSSNHIFDMAVTITIVPLMLGLTVVLCDDHIKKNPNDYLNFLSREKIDVIKLTPSYFKVLIDALNNRRIALPHLKSLVIGGENLSTADCEAWLKVYPNTRLFNEYGPTETTVGTSQFTVTKKNLKELSINVPIGFPGLNMSCFILDSDNQLLPQGEVGELHIAGAGLARGYLNDIEQTQKKFIEDSSIAPRLYKTGDLCRFNEAGVLEYMGRIDHQVKIRGFRVDPSEIEKLLTDHPAIASAAVVPQPDAFNQLRLVAYYILVEDSIELSFTHLRNYLQKYLPDYIIPTAFVGVDAFPLNANGKLDRTALTIPEFHLSEKYREPRNAIEQQLAALWAKELGLKQIGIDDNFFELGGHSLAAARIISQINHHMSKQISFQDLYHHPSIAELSQLIEQNQDAQQEKLHLEPPLNMDWFSLSDFQLMLWLSHTFEPKAGKLNIVARQRVQGHVDKRRLEAAFHTLIKNQQVLMYQVMKLRPAQRLQDEVQFVLSTEHLVDEVECSLEKSMTELRTLYPWPKNASLVIARLFYLPQDRTELQIAMPHIICDEDSLHILFSQLSKLYLTHNESIISQDADYQKYIVNEQHYLENHLDRDLKYWNEYLKNACLLTVPSHYVVKNCQNYSTYQKIDTDDLEQLKQYCAQQQISLHDALCAALILALRDGSEQRKRDTGYLYINIVKSTRDDPDYDATIGCFLRLEPIKVGFRKNMTLLALSEEIRQEKIHTSFYQRCPSLIKLASTYSLRRKNNVFNKFLIRCALAIYAQLSGLSKTYRKIFNVCLARLMGFDRRNQFLINLNIQNSFMADNPSTQFLGLKAQTIAEKHYDLLTIDSVLDVCVLNDLHAQQSYLVFSANLQPEFREYLAMRMMEHIRDVVGVVTV